jgi:hypothetical protein
MDRGRLGKKSVWWLGIGENVVIGVIRFGGRPGLAINTV